MSDRAVFVDAFTIENAGHVAGFWSDDDRQSHCVCSCDWSCNDLSADDALAAWRRHVDAVTGGSGVSDG